MTLDYCLGTNSSINVLLFSYFIVIGQLEKGKLNFRVELMLFKFNCASFYAYKEVNWVTWNVWNARRETICIDFSIFLMYFNSISFNIYLHLLCFHLFSSSRHSYSQSVKYLQILSLSFHALSIFPLKRTEKKVFVAKQDILNIDKWWKILQKKKKKFNFPFFKV